MPALPESLARPGVPHGIKTCKSCAAWKNFANPTIPMNTLKKSFFATLLLIAAATLPCRAGDHPAYLHALSDLRDARAHLERPSGVPLATWDEGVAIKEIDSAIAEIKKASIDDGKNIGDHAPVDAHLDFHGRLHRALELLHKAHADVKMDEDNDFARGLQHRALQHIDAAADFTEQTIAKLH